MINLFSSNESNEEKQKAFDEGARRAQSQDFISALTESVGNEVSRIFVSDRLVPETKKADRAGWVVGRHGDYTPSSTPKETPSDFGGDAHTETRAYDAGTSYEASSAARDDADADSRADDDEHAGDRRCQIGLPCRECSAEITVQACEWDQDHGLCARCWERAEAIRIANIDVEALLLEWHRRHPDGTWRTIGRRRGA